VFCFKNRFSFLSQNIYLNFVAQTYKQCEKTFCLEMLKHVEMLSLQNKYLKFLPFNNTAHLIRIPNAVKILRYFSKDNCNGKQAQAKKLSLRNVDVAEKRVFMR